MEVYRAIETENNRTQKIGEFVRVYQSVDFVSLTWKDAEIQLSVKSEYTSGEASDLSTCLAEAAKIAEHWTLERSGKDAE